MNQQIARPDITYANKNTSPATGTSKWSRMWYWTNVATHEDDRSHGWEARLDAINNMADYHDDDTRQHFFSALAQVLRVEYDPRIRRRAIALLATHFPKECDLVFWRLLEFTQFASEKSPEYDEASVIETARLTHGLITHDRASSSVPVVFSASTSKRKALINYWILAKNKSRFEEYNLEATINWEDGKLRLYAAMRLPEDDFKKLMEAGFDYAYSNEVIFYASYTPWREALLRDHFGIDELVDDDTSMRELTEERAERYEGYSENAAERAKERRQISDQAVAGIPMGQPILKGHHSERRHRDALKKSDANMRKYFDEAERAKHWERRAKSALARIEKRETTQAISRRIPRLESDERKFQRQLDQRPDSQLYKKWLWFTRNRLKYERALLAAMPDEKKPLTADDIETGGAFTKAGQRYWNVISKVARVNAYYHTFDGIRLKVRIDTLTPERYMPPAEFNQAKEAGRMVPRSGNAWEKVEVESEAESEMVMA